MTQEYILNELKTMLSQIKSDIDTESLTLESRLIEDMGLDSLTILLLSFAIEKRFKIRISAAPNFTTIQEVVDYIHIAAE